MAVQLKQANVRDAELRQVQQNVADAVEALSNERSPALGVIGPISSNQKLVGNEDVVLVDASTSTTEIALILPGVKALRRSVTVKVTKAGSQLVRVKAVDISSPTAPAIDGSASVTIAAGQTGSVTVVSDGRNFWTV